MRMGCKPMLRLTHALSIVNLSIALEQPQKKLALFGAADRHLRMIREAFGVSLVSRDEELHISGEPQQVARAVAVLEHMQRKLRRQEWLTLEDVSGAVSEAVAETRQREEGTLEVYAKGRAIKAKTAGQHAYIEAMVNNDLT